MGNVKNIKKLNRKEHGKKMVRWDWNRKLGTCKWFCYDGKTTKVDIYVGNCLGVFIKNFKDAETKKDMYKFMTFFCDEKHLKRCLGLVKGYEDCMKDMIKSIKLNTYYKDGLVLAKWFARSGYKVELYYKDMEEK